MDKKNLQKYIEETCSINDIAVAEGKGRSTVRYWMKKYGLQTKRQMRNKGYHKERKCSYCGTTDESKFYGHKRTICGKCHCKYTLKKGQEKRRYAIELLGGKCVHCGFDKWDCSLDFHHLDPKKKDSTFANLRGWSRVRIEKEMKKCILLCSNCHRAVHYREVKLNIAHVV